MRQNITIAIVLSFLLLITGCGSDSDSFVQTPTVVPQVVSRSLNSQVGGTVLHPSGHSATFAPASLEQDTSVTLSLLSASSVILRNGEEFQPVGQALKVELGGTSVIGQAQFEIPYQTAQPQNHGVYWHLPEGISIPLTSTYNSSSNSFTATVDFTNDALLQSADIRARLDSTTLTISVLLLWLLWRWRALKLLVWLLHARHRERVVRRATTL